MIKPIYINYEVLNQLWHTWASNNVANYDKTYLMPFKNVNRKHSKIIEFETWLYAETGGGVVRQRHKKLYIEFSDHKQATLCLLKNNISQL